MKQMTMIPLMVLTTVNDVHRDDVHRDDRHDGDRDHHDDDPFHAPYLQLALLYHEGW
jgi:hypothetical protein